MLDTTSTKCCSKCTQTKLLDFFAKQASCQYGRRPECKDCAASANRVYRLANLKSIKAKKRAAYLANLETVKVKSRLYYLENTEERKKASRAYYAANREKQNAQTKVYSQAHRAESKIYKDAHYEANKKKQNAQKRLHYAANTLRLNAVSRAYQKSHPEVASKGNQKRRAMKVGNGVFVVTAKELKKIRKSLCIYCGAPGPSHVDHVIPLARGGRHSIGNLQPLCGRCNMSKGSSFYIVFRVRADARKQDCVNANHVVGLPGSVVEGSIGTTNEGKKA